MHVTIAQVMDIGPMVPGTCAFSGLVIFGTLFVTALCWKNGAHKRVAKPLTLIVLLPCVVWVGFAIDEVFYEPHITEEEALSLVEALPEVQPYLSNDPDKTDWGNPLLQYPDNGAGEFDFGPQSHPELRLRVNLNNSTISAFDPEHGWLPIDQWRRGRATRNTHFPNTP